MYRIRATGHGRTATEPAGTDQARAATLTRRTANLRDVDTAELLSPTGKVIATYPERKEFRHAHHYGPLLGSEAP